MKIPDNRLGSNTENCLLYRIFIWVVSDNDRFYAGYTKDQALLLLYSLACIIAAISIDPLITLQKLN